jgi:hypothetical protein
MNTPRLWELELIRHWGYFFDDLEGSIALWGQFGFLMVEFEVGCF